MLAAIESGNGKAVLTTVSGGKLKSSIENGKVKLTDEAGNLAFATIADLKGTIGVVHVINGVGLPK